jgi:LAO/AO transport system kinase
MMLDLNQDMLEWRPPIKRTVASCDEGVVDLVTTIDEHIAHLNDTGKLTARRTERTKNELLAMLNEQIGRHVLTHVRTSGDFDQMVASIKQR